MLLILSAIGYSGYLLIQEDKKQDYRELSSEVEDIKKKIVVKKEVPKKEEVKIVPKKVIKKKKVKKLVKRGCKFNHPYVINYSKNSQVVESGKCSIECCAKPGYEFFEKDCQATAESYKRKIASIGLEFKGKVVSDYQCGAKIGCTYNASNNYDAEASKEAGNCNITCCATKNKSDYDPACQKTIDDYVYMLKDLKIDIRKSGAFINNNHCERS